MFYEKQPDFLGTKIFLPKKTQNLKIGTYKKWLI